MLFSSALPVRIGLYSQGLSINILLLSLTVSEENEEAAENRAATCVELQRELITGRQEIEQNPSNIDEAHASVTHEICNYCLHVYSLAKPYWHV